MSNLFSSFRFWTKYVLLGFVGGTIVSCLLLGFRTAWGGGKPLQGVRISWYGTSIPACGYPQIVGDITGAIVANEAMGSSACRRGAFMSSYDEDPYKLKGLPWPVPVYGLMKSSSEIDDVFVKWDDYVDTWSGIYEGEQGAPTNSKPRNINDGKHSKLKSILRNLCYDVKVARHCGINHPYNTGSVDMSDIYVIEHAYNDVQPIFGDKDSNYTTIPDDPYDVNTPIGSINALIRYIYEKNSRAIILLIGHYECQTSTGMLSKNVIENVAEYWSVPLLKLYDLTGISQRKITTNGYWADGLIWHEKGFSFLTSGENWMSNNIALSFNMVSDSFSIGKNSDGMIIGTHATKLKEILGIKEGNEDACWQPTRQMLLLPDNLHPNAYTTKVYFANLISNWIVSVFTQKKY